MHHGLNLLIAKWKAFLLFALPQCLLDLLVGQGEVLTMSRRFASKAQQIDFEPEYVEELRAMTPAAITRPQRYAALITEGDEVLDWREMAARYAGARLRVLPGGDHAISDFEQHLPWALQALGLAESACVGQA